MVNGRAGDVRGAEIAPTRQLPCLLAPSSWKSSYVAFSCRPPWTPPPKPDLNVEVYTRRKINLERCSTAEDGCGLDGNVRVGGRAANLAHALVWMLQFVYPDPPITHSELVCTGFHYQDSQCEVTECLGCTYSANDWRRVERGYLLRATYPPAISSSHFCSTEKLHGKLDLIRSQERFKTSQRRNSAAYLERLCTSYKASHTCLYASLHE
ncbi:hypothetical protein F2P81_007351 [Scophthalmus maximus]|uniref:Uncharacterized protein n=1 Tax=Scophthalmus maximus TaxID=52904 RepID=A0A6A4T630_SCOMX|nr:hypothetical protein F2P81_007351 [Scophthalmus maximus]